MSGVNKPKAAIVIKKEELIAFFRIEAEFCGYECEICETPPQDPSLYDLVLIDPTVGLCVSHAENCHVVALIDEKTKNPLSWATEIWEWPMSVEEIHGALARIKWSRPWQTSEHRKAEAVVRDTSLYLVSREQGTILYHNQTLTLTPSEMTILCALSDAYGSSVSGEHLQEMIGGGMGNNVVVHICNLRKQLDRVSTQRIIETKRGKGYALTVPLIPLQ